MNIETKYIISNSLEETINIGTKFASQLKQGDTVLFYGDLGVGKTEFIKAICNTFAVKQMITSPTFTIVNQYEGMQSGQAISILHIDLYRIQKREELVEMGFQDYIYSTNTIKFVEWAERSFDFITSYNYKVTIIADDTNEFIRKIQIEHA